MSQAPCKPDPRFRAALLVFDDHRRLHAWSAPPWPTSWPRRRRTWKLRPSVRDEHRHHAGVVVVARRRLRGVARDWAAEDVVASASWLAITRMSALGCDSNLHARM